MELSSSSYVPSLRIRRAELQALQQMPRDLLRRIHPIFTLPPLEYDFETRKNVEDINSHVNYKIKQILKYWEGDSCWVDVHKDCLNYKLDQNRPIITELISSLSSDNSLISTKRFVPVVSLDAIDEVKQEVFDLASRKDNRGFALRVRFENMISSNSVMTVKNFLDSTSIEANLIDFILDLGAPSNYLPIEIFAKSAIMFVNQICDCFDFRNVIIISTAIPRTFRKEIEALTLYPRYEWKFFKELISAKCNWMPVYGDYTIVHPEWNANIELDRINPSARIVYARETEWVMRVGTSFAANPSQMHALCKEIVRSGYFDGEAYSEGCKYILGCANYIEKPSSLNCWKRVGINQHMTVVLNGLANLRDPT